MENKRETIQGILSAKVMIALQSALSWYDQIRKSREDMKRLEGLNTMISTMSAAVR